MSRVVIAAAAATFVALLAPDGSPWIRPAFDTHAAVGGGVVDLGTGRMLQRVPPAEFGGSGSVTVLPYGRGDRYRIPLLVNVAAGTGPITVTGIALNVPRSWTAFRSAGAVVSHVCCTLHHAEPFSPTPVPGPGRFASQLMLGIDVELCCDAPAGWVEVLTGVHLTYERDGGTFTEYYPFPDVQTIVVGA